MKDRESLPAQSALESAGLFYIATVNKEYLVIYETIKAADTQRKFA